MKKRSIFTKIFFINIIVLVVGIFLLAVMEYALITQYIYEERVDSLRDNSRAIEDFISSGNSVENIDKFLYGFSRYTNKSILVIDTRGKILIASADAKFFNEKANRIDENYCKKVLERNENTVVGTLGDVYKSDMFTLQVPITDRLGRRVVGAIFISTPVPEIQAMRTRILRITGISIILAVLLSLLLSFVVSRRISKPIKEIGKVVQNFAKGDFSNRVETEGGGYNITEVSDLAESFNNMAHDLEMADSVKKNFISDVSHELRTPMTTIGGFVDGILDDTIPQEKHKEYLKIVKDEITRFSGILNSFLDVTRLRTGRLTLSMTDFDINDVICCMLINLEARLNSKNIKVDIELENESCFVKADIDSIKRVLINLLDNAIKFTNQGGTITVKVYTRHQDVFVSVRNTGIGIADNERKMIFERFYKVDKSRGMNPEGTGIGLYMVKDILIQHGKDIKVESVEGEFAEFTFSLAKSKK